jgi:hypothetical protein
MTDLNPVDAMTNPYRAMCAELLSSGDAMTTDYRTMCAKLVDALESGIPARRIRLSPLADRARALLAQPEPEELTDEALDEMERRYWKLGSSIEIEPEGISEVWDREETFDHRAFARAAISAACARARFDHPTPQPVAVSERLPGAKDCALWPGDPEVTPWCWAGKDIDGGWEWAQISMLGLGTDTLSRIIAGGGWTHWLPANALPAPEAKP